ncbi:MAG: hypothetical protein KC503_40865, partial [Myxococcales bacterium]|nr:hypothetical protein [Myxococcales bacterium]
WLGTRALELPRVSLAVSSLVWTVFAPPRNIYGALSVRGGSQTLYGHLRWQRPAVSGNADASDDGQSGGAVGAVNTTQADLDASSGSGGAMPVRIKVPKRGTRLEVARYWVRRAEPIGARLPFISRSALYPGVGAAALLYLAALLLLLRRAGRWPLRVITSLVTLGAGALLWRTLGARAVVGLALLVLLVQGLRGGALLGAASSVLVWARGLRRRFAERERPEPAPGRSAGLRQLLLFAALALAVTVVVTQAVKLLVVLL